MTIEDEQRFDAAFHTHHDAVRRYLARRCDDHSTVDDLVAETFLVAWRRRERLPDDALPWLYVVARNQLANNRRNSRSYERMLARLRRLRPEDLLHEQVLGARDPHPILRALEGLSAMDQEVLRLHAFEDLTREQAAAVLGCRPATYGVRLHRATRRLRAALEASPTAEAALHPTPTTGRDAR